MPIQVDNLRFIDGSDMRTYGLELAGGDVRQGTVRYLVRGVGSDRGRLLAEPHPDAQAVRIVGRKATPLVMDSGTTFYVERVK